MPIALILLLEKLATSPVAQEAAWALIRPYLSGGHTVPASVIATADMLADKAHAECQS